MNYLGGVILTLRIHNTILVVLKKINKLNKDEYVMMLNKNIVNLLH